jgi:RNA polymerase sigma-70 factor, ECF subfamily
MNYRQQMLVGMESPELRERLVRTLILHRRIERADAEDAVQDAYMYALRTKSPWDGRSKLRTWLTRVAINASLMRHRKRARIEKHETIFDDAMKITSDFSQHDRVFALERLELFEDVILAEMSPGNRQAILLLVADPDGGFRGISERAGIPVNTFKAQVHRARNILRAVL